MVREMHKLIQAIQDKVNKEQAQTLNKIEHTIQEKESSILYSVKDTLAIDSSEEF